VNIDMTALTDGLPTALVLAAFAAILLIALFGGHALGVRRSTRARRTLQRTLAERELELLEARADAARLGKVLTETPRRERVLRFALARLSAARARERARFVEVSRLRLSLAESTARNRQIMRLATRATSRVRELEAVAGATGTITTRAAKSYGNGEAVTVSVVDHETPEARRDGVASVPHIDRARLARLAPSNEARCPGDLDVVPGELSAIDGLAEDDEHRLAEHGIRRLEQLASLTENELDSLIAATDGRRLIGDARALLERRSNR